ncbi:MAG: prepilin-type N-terminal cleavage/methylation domain-containing protein [Verrucomicrobiaceae bacterium]|nr:prepilin-type N-terminal cleavage/methylation domain-containing protein [Verrucomicrobiaceae bacterium]
MPRPQGFTLLETAITLFIVALLVAAVFGILQSSLQLADGIRGEQERELRVQKFVELCETLFNHLPPDAVISIRPEKGFGSQSQLLEIANGLSPFDAATPGTVTLATAKAADSSPAALLSYEETPVNFASTRQQNTTRPVQLALLNDISTLTWSVFDPQSQKWINKWNENITAADLLKSGGSMIPAAGLPPEGQNLAQNPATPAVGPDGQPIPTTPLTGNPQAAGSTSAYPRPPMLELQLALGGEEPRRWIFWVPASFSQ